MLIGKMLTVSSGFSQKANLVEATYFLNSPAFSAEPADPSFSWR